MLYTQVSICFKEGTSMKLLFLWGLLLTTFSASQANGQQATLHTVQKHIVQNWFQIEARVEAVNKGTMSAQTSGRIQQVLFDVNDYVEKGALMVQLRDKQQQAAVKTAQAQLVQARATHQDYDAKFKRSQPLLQKGSLSQGDFDSIKAQAISAAAAVKAAKALLEQAQEQLSYTQVRAPYAGIVKTRHVEVGESVSPGTKIMSGLSLNKLRAVAHIPQRLAPFLNKHKIHPQRAVKITHEGHPQTVQNVTLFPYANENSHSFKVRVEFSQNEEHNNSQLFPGMWVKLHLSMGDKQVMTVPQSAVMLRGELSTVFVATKKGAVLRQVRLGETQNGQVEVLAGLREGERIYVDAYARLANPATANAAGAK